LKKLKEEYTAVDEGEKLISVDFAEKVAVAEKSVNSAKVMSFDEAYQLITTELTNRRSILLRKETICG